MKSEPTASVIISAYNRPHVLAFAMRSVLQSDFNDWELIIVGDGCNEETEKTVRDFIDPRIRFFNLEANTGSQSEPHNTGVRHARGKFVLFLNQDDMYFSDHISKSVGFMQESDADIAWSPVVVLEQGSSESGSIDVSQDKVKLNGVVTGDRFDPTIFIISSSWVVRREICHAVGPWLAIEKTRLAPSQEWLYRAYRQGRRMVHHRYVSVLCIHSGARRYSYVNPRSIEHERAWSWVNGGPSERAKLLNCVAVQQAAEIQRSRWHGNRWLRCRYRAKTLLARAGIHPHAARRFFRGMGKGRWVENHRQFTAQPPKIRSDAALRLGKAEAESFLGQGWHAGEGAGRWTAAGTAEIYFSLPSDEWRGFLELSGHLLRQSGAVSFSLNDREPISHVFKNDDTVVRLPVTFSGPFRLTITVGPLALERSADGRIRGFWVSWLRIVEDASASGTLSEAAIK